jgi:hypothetical protein
LDKWFPIRFILILVTLVLCNLVGTSSAQVRGLPDQISDQDFWRTITELSEPSGQYTGDNWISNEPTIQDVIPPLKQLIKPGGVYLGVGPEQNFTYMWALQSKIGFIIDIRRQNMLDVLLFKTLFEMAPDRADFISLLFSRRRPDGLTASTSAAALMASYEAAPKEGLAVNMEKVRSTLASHKYGLSSDDLATIEFIYTIFNRGGPSITAEFASPGGPSPAVPITYTNLMTATDRNGQPWSYLSSEAAYQYVRELHRKNLIIPLVGDFAGPSTIRKVSDYLKERNSTVAAFYVSNVEYYLSGATLKRFQANVATLPIDPSSIFIRWAMRTPYATWNTDPNRLVMTLAPISELVDLQKADRAPASFAEILGATKEPQTVVASMQDSSLRKVTGRVTGITSLKAGELVRIVLVENLRQSGLIVEGEVAADGSFTVKNVTSRTYQAIVLRSCRGCSSSRVAGSPVNVVVADKDITGLQLVLDPQ